MPWIWFQDPAVRTAAENMTLDERLLEIQGRDSDSQPIVRIYTWASPAVTFGRLQHPDAVKAAYPDLEIARRPTGGRAVLHGDDLTITIALRAADAASLDCSSVNSSFRAIAQPIIDALNSTGRNCGFGEGRRRADNHYDCFGHAATCDIVDFITGEKIVGCAQRRIGDAILQQMSVAGFGRHMDFPATIRAKMSSSYSVTEWCFVDTEMGLCYT